jgi:hypothetical protein
MSTRQHIESVKSLNLSLNPELSDVALLGFAKFPNLTTVNLRECSMLTDEGITTLIEGCGHNLESLDLTKCSLISDNGVANIARFCPRLRSIALGHTKVGDAGLGTLAQACKELRSIDLSALNVTDDSLKSLSQCPELGLVSLFALFFIIILSRKSFWE